jgi:hypothetical protein
LAGSESEKSSDFDSDPETVVKYNLLGKITDQTLEREKTYVFQLEKFVLCRTDSRRRMKAPFKKFWVKLLVEGSEFETESDKNVDPNPKNIIRIHNTG